MLQDPKERFTETVEHYREHRPSYPRALVDWIVSTSGIAPGGRVVDVGCGTGIASRLFAARGFDVVGIDPNEAMLMEAEKAGGAVYRKGEAAATGLPDAAADLVIAAQAAHWFDLPAAFLEWRRILTPDGWCALFWNLRARSPFMDEYERILREFSSEYARVPDPRSVLERLRAAPGLDSRREAEFPHAQELDLAGLLGRARSSSYVAHGVRNRDGFERALRAAFERHETGGRIRFEYVCTVIAWRFASPAG